MTSCRRLFVALLVPALVVIASCQPATKAGEYGAKARVPNALTRVADKVRTWIRLVFKTKPPNMEFGEPEVRRGFPWEGAKKAGEETIETAVDCVTGDNSPWCTKGRELYDRFGPKTTEPERR